MIFNLSAPFLSIVCVYLCLAFPWSSASAWANTPNTPQSSLPEKLGTMLYQVNPAFDNQIYIIAQKHRSALASSNDSNTNQIQSEIYRIGEWLFTNRQVELLLPEGFFQRQGSPSALVSDKYLNRPLVWQLDDKTLAANLADNRRFVNADMLLNYYLNINIQQIEDKDLYLNTRSLLKQLYTTTPSADDPLPTVLSYQQKKRSAVILQNIPHVLENEFKKKTINNKNAMLTIGMSHVDEIIRFLSEGRAEIAKLTDYDEKYDCNGYSQNLSRLKDHFGITVIAPKSMAANQFPSQEI